MNQDFEIENGKLIKYHGNDKEVMIPDGVTSIGDSAFLDCYNLNSVIIGNGVTSIEERTFDS